MATYPFWKLHGLGNDFVFFDAMEEEFELSTAEVAALAIAIPASEATA